MPLRHFIAEIGVFHLGIILVLAFAPFNTGLIVSAWSLMAVMSFPYRWIKLLGFIKSFVAITFVVALTFVLYSILLFFLDLTIPQDPGLMDIASVIAGLFAWRWVVGSVSRKCVSTTDQVSFS